MTIVVRATTCEELTWIGSPQIHKDGGVATHSCKIRLSTGAARARTDSDDEFGTDSEDEREHETRPGTGANAAEVDDVDVILRVSRTGPPKPASASLNAGLERRACGIRN